MNSKKYINRIVSFLTIICCLAGSAMAAPAVKAEESTPRAVFTNEPNEAPDLYITKELQNPESYNGNLEDLHFSFVLKLNGKAANKQEYTVIKNGEEKKNEEGRVEVYKTESGRFELGPGETAWFRNLTVGSSYEVTENEMPESFQQVEPEGGAGVAGIITAKGEDRKFVNRYVPNIPGGPATLTVSKTITFPEGYAMPETPEFEFVLTVDGEPYGMKTYALTDDRTGQSAGTGTTDADGRFKLKGGYTASFAKVKAGVDYKLEEINIPEGWRATGSTVLEGAITAPETPLIMNNAAASFGVSKEVKGNGNKDGDFTFLLTKEDGAVWAGAKYYLYSLSTGELIEEPKEEQGKDEPEFENPAYTKEDGTFTLKHGQTAVFVGIGKDTVCNIKEIGAPDYIQTLPTSRDGYEHTVTDIVIVLPFENQFIDNRGSLTVTKNVENLNGDAPEPGDEGTAFTFKLTEIKTEEKDGVETVVEKPVANAIYSSSVGGSTRTPKTDEEGKFSLEEDETARFGSLPFGKYKVKEISVPEAYKVKSEKEQILELTRDCSAAFTFINQYRADKLDLNLVKQNREADRLPEVSFTLWKETETPEEGAKWEDIKKSEVGTYTTDAEGNITVPGLESGVYYLQETQTATGYMPWEKPLRIKITRDTQDRDKVTVEAERKSVSTSEGEDIDLNQDQIPRGSVVKKLTLKQEEGKRDTAELTVINEMLYELPNSGGSGIFWSILSGIALMMAAVLLYWKKIRIQVV